MNNRVYKENKDSNLILSVNELTLLLNELYIDSCNEFKIIDGLYGLELLNIKLDDEIKIDLRSNLDDIKNAYYKVPKEYRREFPDKLKYFDIFIKSGFYFKKYQGEFEGVLNEIDNLNILEGDMPIAIAFDTNLYYDQFFSHFSCILKNKYRNTKYPIYFLLSEGVKKELITYEDKYKGEDIDKFRQFCPYRDIVDEFFNQNKFHSRIKHLGHMDFLKCNEGVYSKIIDEEVSINRRDMDSRIIEGLIKEIHNQNIKLFLFSEDSDFIARARGNRNLIAKHLERIPLWKLEEKYSCNWEIFDRFLYILAITFGAIIIDIQDYPQLIIHGIWRGKKLFDWEKENVKIITSNPILDKIEKDILILRKIKLEESFYL
ncbi:MAG: hypothetical protein EU549_03805 [Promethearchaeota archaeon]|nr:MAG: hypothetical protein EU549_03805 [Candidatus Lokiarchaeota archaeon]